MGKVKEVVEGVRKFLRLTEDGREVADATPVEIPVHMKRPKTLQEQMREMVMAVHQEVNAGQQETLEEFEDFDIPDDPIDPQTPFEKEFELAERDKESKAKVEALQAELKEYRVAASRKKRKPVQQDLPQAGPDGQVRGERGQRPPSQ